MSIGRKGPALRRFDAPHNTICTRQRNFLSELKRPPVLFSSTDNGRPSREAPPVLGQPDDVKACGQVAAPAEQLRSILGITDVNYAQGRHALAVVDSSLA